MLKMNHVTITFQDVNPPQQVVEDFSLSMEPGEIVGIVGESGSGKTMTALSLMGLLKRDAKGQYEFYGKRSGFSDSKRVGGYTGKRNQYDFPGAHDFSESGSHHRQADGGESQASYFSG